MKSLLRNNASEYLLLIVLFISSFLYYAPSAHAISSISGSDSATSSVGVALPISDIQIVGNSASTTPVKLVVSNGSLTITNTGGLGSLSGTTGSTITFTATVEDANEALETLTYTRNATGSDALEVSLVGASEVFFSGNNHLYEYIASVGDWDAAETAAAALTRYGATGYLTTITSEEENDFAAARLGGAGWMGASDVSVEGAWRWVTGPESGTQFWSGDGSGNTIGGNYANWASGEPNDSGNEDCAQFLSGGSGEWNDLPCSGTTLPGYVVEFGAAGDMPTVIAKDITLATIESPTVDTLLPADNATNVNGDDDLVITFSEIVTTGTGTVDIYRSSDDTLIESISVTSSQVTGSGTASITIDPTDSLADSTEFYIKTASTTFKNASDVFFLGILDTTTWSFTTGDYTGPVFSNITADPEQESVVITWSTDESASSQIVYGEDNSMNLSTSETNTSPRVSSHSVSIADLEQCTEYSYRVTGVDGSSNSNSATSTIQSFTTEGCSSGSSATRKQSKETKEIKAEEPTSSEEGDNSTELRSLWENNKLNEAVLMIQNNPAQATNDPELTIKILQSFLTALQKESKEQKVISNIEVRDLYLDMSGDDVRMLQELLIKENTGPAAVELARVTATGYFSTYTKNALGEYQQANGIVPHIGYFGKITRAQMKQSNLEGLWW